MHGIYMIFRFLLTVSHTACLPNDMLRTEFYNVNMIVHVDVQLMRKTFLLFFPTKTYS